LRHFSSDLSHVKALPEDHSCTSPVTSGAIASAAPPKGVLGLALAARDVVRGWITPRPLMAASRGLSTRS
jgi:hypothetical protein